MAQIIKHRVIFNCVCCHKEINRQANSHDYLGRIIMPKGWGYLRILNDFKEFCNDKKCQDVLNKCTVGFQVDQVTN